MNALRTVSLMAATVSTGLVAGVFASAGYWRLERDQRPTPEEPGDTES
jgi:hypothetical protein